jgi:hypothetical protein
MSSRFIAPNSSDGSVGSSALFGNEGNARMWRALSGLFLAVGVLALLIHIWDVFADLRARRNWPITDGEIVSAQQRDDSDLSLKTGSISSRTRYWIEYEVRFAVPQDRCMNGISYSGPSGSGTSCSGIVRTRSTQSAHKCYQWLIHGYYPNEPVKVLYNPNGADIKIAGESIWLRFNFDRLTVDVLWVLAFGVLYAFSQHRLHYLENHPETKIAQTDPQSRDKQKLTTLSLS